MTRRLVLFSLVASTHSLLSGQGDFSIYLPDDRSCWDVAQRLHLTASLDRVPVEILELRPVGAGSPVVVIADAADCAHLDYQCVSEVAPHLKRLRQSGIMVLLFGYPWSKGFQPVDFGGPLEYVAVAGIGSEAVPWTGARFGFGPAHELIRAVAMWFAGNAEPVRIIWVGARFYWFDWRRLMDPPEDFPFLKKNYGESLQPHVGVLSSRGVSISPTVVAKHTRRGYSRRDRVTVQSAEHLARYTGGVVHLPVEPPGAALQAAIDASNRGYVIRIRVPSDDRNRHQVLRKVEIRNERNNKCRYSRAFLSDDRVSPEPDPLLLERTSSRIVAASPIALAPRHCEASGEGVELMLPDTVGRVAGLTVVVQYDSGVAGLTKRRYQFKAGEKPCVPLEAANGVTFRLFAFDAAASWVGAVLGKVEKPEQ